MNTMPYILSRFLNRIPFLLLLLAMVMSVSAQAKPQLSLEQTVSKTTVKAGEPFTYSLRIAVQVPQNIVKILKLLVFYLRH